MPKRKEPGKSLRIKVISMGNAEVGKVSTALGGAGPQRGGATCRLAGRAATQQPGRPASSPPLSRPGSPEAHGSTGKNSPDLFDLWVAPLRHLRKCLEWPLTVDYIPKREEA